VDGTSSTCACQPHGVDKDERALAIEKAEIERLARTATTSSASWRRNVSSVCAACSWASARGGPEGLQAGTKITRAYLAEHLPREQWSRSLLEDEETMAQLEAMSVLTSQRKPSKALPRQGRQAQRGDDLRRA
jgi:DNA-directed RNA polymerase subunit beta